MPGALLDKARAAQAGGETAPPGPLPTMQPGSLLAKARAAQGAQAPVPAASAAPPALPAAMPTAPPFLAQGPAGPQTREQQQRRVALHKQAAYPTTRLAEGAGIGTTLGALGVKAMYPQTRLPAGVKSTLGGLGAGTLKPIWNMASTLDAMLHPDPVSNMVRAATDQAMEEEYFAPYAEASPTAEMAGGFLGSAPVFGAAGKAAEAVPAATRLGKLGVQAAADALAIQPTLSPETPLEERAKQTVMAPALGTVTRAVPAAIEGAAGLLKKARAAQGLPPPEAPPAAPPEAPPAASYSPELPQRISLEEQTKGLPAVGEKAAAPPSTSPEAQKQAAYDKWLAQHEEKLKSTPPLDPTFVNAYHQQLWGEFDALRSPERARKLQQYEQELPEGRRLVEEENGSLYVRDPYGRKISAGSAAQPVETTRSARAAEIKPESTVSSGVATPTTGSTAQLPKTGWRTPLTPGGEQLAAVQSAGLPRGRFYALDQPFESAVHDPANAVQEALPSVRRVYDPDGLLGPPTPRVAAPKPGAETELGAPKWRQKYTDALKAAGYDAYVRGIDGDPANRELIVFGGEKAATPPPAPPVSRAAEMSAKLAAEPRPTSPEPIGEMGGKQLVNLPSGSTRVAETVEPTSTALVPAGGGGEPPRGGPPARRVLEAEPVGPPPGEPRRPPSETAAETEAFFKRTAVPPKKGVLPLLGRVAEQVKKTFVTAYKLRGKHKVYDPKLGETDASTSFADARDEMRLLADAPRHASSAAIDAIRPILSDLTPEQYQLLRRKVVVEDLLETQRRGGQSPLPQDALLNEQARLDAALAKEPAARAAYERDQALWQAVGNDLVKRGKLSAENLRQHYLHHEVLDYLESGGKIGSPFALRNVRRQYLKRRAGSTRDIYTDYLDVRYRSLAKVLRDNMVDDAVQRVADRYGVTPEVGKKLGYTPFSVEELWQVAGKTSHDQAIMRMVQDISKDVDPGIARQVLSQIEERLLKRKVYIHPDLAESLGSLRDAYRDPGMLAKATGAWKQTMLNKNPPRYNFNNLIGDSERAWNATPEAFKDGGAERFKRVLRDIRDAEHGKPSADYQLARKYSVVDSGEVYHEIGAIKESDLFRNLDPTKQAAWRHPLAKASNALRHASTARENMLRLQVFYANLERMRAGKSLFEGVSDVKGLSDPVAVAAKVSREALGDYGDMTPREQAFRRGLLPFYSWLKINTSFWPQLFARKGGQVGGRAVAQAAPRVALKTGAVALKATALYAAAAAWNNSTMLEQEEQLPDDVRKRFHINTGLKDSKGKWVTITEPTAMSDFLDSVGLEGVTTTVAQALRGQLTAADLKDEAVRRVAAPVRKVASRVTPAITAPVEAVTGRKFYPDPLNPSPSMANNPLSRFLEGAGAGEFNDPRATVEAYKRSWLQLGAVGVRRYDAGLSALRNIEDRTRRFKERRGYKEEPSEGPNTDANREVFYALSDKDFDRAETLLKKTSPQSFARYLAARDPLRNIPLKFRSEFLREIGPSGVEQLNRARQFVRSIGVRP